MSLNHKIDFAVIFTVTNANPNGDPLDGNRPRTTLEGLGEISDVCLKRKIRNKLMDMGQNIFVQSDDRRVDDYKTLKERATPILKQKGTSAELAQKACQEWYDVRAFGQVFALKDKDAAKGTGVSIGIRGPVTIQPAFSKDTVNITSTQITKSVSNDGDGSKKSSDTHFSNTCFLRCLKETPPLLDRKAACLFKKSFGGSITVKVVNTLLRKSTTPLKSPRMEIL